MSYLSRHYCRSSLLKAAVVVLANHAWRNLTRLDRDGLVNHAFLLRVVTHFHVARDREILAERMAHEAVVGQDTAQIVMAFKDDAKQVKRLAFKPVCGVP